MKSVAMALAIAGLSIALPSCASYPPAQRGHLAALENSAYYDDAYGAFYDGYWGDDGSFYYCPGPGAPFLRDGGGHFRHSGGAGFHGVHVGGGRR